jgi:FlaG/FlaF family flagellin (archaellin)
VFGISTPGRPIYQGGFDDNSIKEKADGASDDELKVVGRRGGHTFVLDDGDQSGSDQLVRIRTSSGHQIMMNDSDETLIIMHASGKSYIELGKSGTVDIFAEDSFSVRARGDINLHADKNININAGEKITMSAKNMHQQTTEDFTQHVQGEYISNVLKGYSLKVNKDLLMNSNNVASFEAKSMTYVCGKKVKLNSGNGPSPKTVNRTTPLKHADTQFDATVGFMSVDAQLETVVSRAPTHFPWPDASLAVYPDAGDSKAPSQGVKDLAS